MVRPSPMGTTRGMAAPMAKIAASGGLTMAVNDVTPYIPRFEMVNVARASPRNLPCRASATR